MPDRPRAAHPDADALADLAADVLPPERATAVQEHVVGCELCAGLLAGAEGIRGLLLADDPGPMPPEVLARIEAAIAAAPAAAGPAAAAPAAGPVPIGSGAAIRRRSRGPQRTRRQARDEDRGSRSGRRGTWLLAAAAAAIAIGGGALAVRELVLPAGGSGSGATTASDARGIADSADAGAAGPERDASSAEAPVPAAGAGGVVVATGTDYSAKDLSAQVTRLVDRVALAGASGRTGARELQRTTTGNQTLRTPAALRACLAAIDAADQQPLAVDLARYERQEAAIVVLPGRDGGYEVWAVARTCGPGGDGTLKFALVRRAGG